MLVFREMMDMVFIGRNENGSLYSNKGWSKIIKVLCHHYHLCFFFWVSFGNLQLARGSANHSLEGGVQCWTETRAMKIQNSNIYLMLNVDRILSSMVQNHYYTLSVTLQSSAKGLLKLIRPKHLICHQPLLTYSTLLHPLSEIKWRRMASIPYQRRTWGCFRHNWITWL